VPKEPASLSEQAFRDLLEALGTASETITGPLGAVDMRERAEGYRNLTRILSVGLDMVLEKGDPERPAFTRWTNPYRKLLGDNPGTFYESVFLDPGLSYRIHGQRGNPLYFAFCVYGTAESGARRIVSNLSSDDLHFEEDGSFEIVLSTAHPIRARNWVELSADTTDMLARQYFAESKAQEPAVYEIEAIPAAPRPAAITEEQLALRLAAVGRFVHETVAIEATISTMISQATPHILRSGDEMIRPSGEAPGPQVDPDIVAKAMPTPDMSYTGTWYENLGDDEVLIVEGKPPDSRYWSIQLMNRWMESADYLHYRVYLTGESIISDEEGRFRVVIAHQDPDVANWLETTGLLCGQISVRAIKLKGELEIGFRREKLADARASGFRRRSD
jgi:hypothetical protein